MESTLVKSVKYTLAKSLKYKNRIIQMIRYIERIIKDENSHLVGTESEVDVRKLLDLRNKFVENLVSLKSKINDANTPIQLDIYKKDELKSLISFLRSIETKHGKVLGRYSSEPHEYVANIRQKEIDKQIVDIQLEIDNIQDKLDAFNQKTLIDIIEVDFNIL